MSNKVIYVVKDKLQAYPPCVSQIVMLRDLGISVYVISETCEPSTESVIKNAGANIKILGNLLTRHNIFGRILHWINFKRLAIKEIKKVYNENDVIWLGTERTGMVIGSFIKNKKAIFNSLELYTKESLFGRLIGRIIKNTHAVVACELNRARIMKIWYSLEKIPYVMQNKPYYETTTEKSDAVTQFQKQLENKKYILYQGILNPERPLDTLVTALNHTKEHYTLVIIGEASNKSKEKEMIDHLKGIYPDVIFGGFFPAPQHLYITENAFIGVAIYEASSINTIFCAPNKTFEYAKYNVPVIGNDIPGLQLTIEKFNAGICTDINDCESLTLAIDEISDNYENYKKGAKNFYKSVNNLKVMEEIAEDLKLI